MPEGAGLVETFGDRRILDDAGLEGGAEHIFQRFAQRPVGGGRQFDQHIPLMHASQRIAHAGAVLEHELQADARHDLAATSPSRRRARWRG